MEFDRPVRDLALLRCECRRVVPHAAQSFQGDKRLMVSLGLQDGQILFLAHLIVGLKVFE